MSRSAIIVHSPGNRNRIELEGEGLNWGSNPNETHWDGFDRVTFVTESERKLHIDVAPDASSAGASLPNPRDKLTLLSSLIVGASSGLGPITGGNRRELKPGSNLWVTFFWPNPLTPLGAGLWFRLHIELHEQVLKVSQRVMQPPKHGTRLWYAKGKNEPEWRKIDRLFGDDPNLDHLSFEAFASQRFGLGDEKEPIRIDEPGFLLGKDWKDGAASASCLGDLRKRDFVYAISAGDSKASPQILGTAAKVVAAKPTLLNPRAFGSGDEAIDRAQLFATDFDLHCVGQDRSPEHSSDGERTWILDWAGIPMGPPPDGRDALTLPRLWHFLSLHYAVGLGAVRARNRFSLIPTQIESKRKDAPPARLRFELATDPKLAGKRLQLRQIAIGSQALTLKLGAAQQFDGSAPALTCTVADSFAYEGGKGRGLWSIQEAAFRQNPFSRDLIALGAATATSGEIDWILGGARTSAEKLVDFGMAVRLHPATLIGEQRPIEIDLQMKFDGGTLVPVSQDPEPGFETLSGWLDRPRPIAIDMNASPERPLKLEMEERASDDASRVLRIVARNADNAKQVSFNSDVVVIDQAPLTIARVTDEVTLAKGEIVGEYLDDSENPPGWEFTNRDGTMRVTLPPQAIGEEMVKGRLALDASDPDTEIPFKGEPFDYRLGANAGLLVDRTDIDTARTAPPWMLRRHLNRRTGVTGLKLVDATFELVYGLTTEVRAQGLRVGELDALIGRIPLPDQMVRLLRNRELDGKVPSVTTRLSGKAGQIQSEYAFEQGTWIAHLLRRVSWWPLFRDAADRRQLKIAEDVQVTLRKARQTAHPFDIAKFKDGQAPKAGERKPLRGGADWMFQSPNIYSEFVGDPESTDALVEGVAFGPLGARGAQTARFANGKTIIISRTDQGYLESLVLMRIGRIGMLWNHARHVIVYQRSSRRAPRYEAGGGGPYTGDTYDAQRPDFDGFMAMRKIREYVEITQPRRSFPDFDDRLPFAGPIRQSTFETTVIPVKASWAQDVDQGQVIPLFGPVSEKERRFFPRPKVFVEMARAAEKGGGLIASEAADPSQLYFFTSTRAKDGGNTDAWPAWPDIDFPLIQVTAPPKLSYRPAFTGARRQPNAARADFGQRRFTIDLIPNEEAANLMHGRQPNALEARVMSVSLARGRLDVKPNDKFTPEVLTTLANADALIADQLAELQNQARLHAQAGHDAGSAEHRQFVADARKIVAKLQSDAVALADTLSTKKKEFADRSALWWKRQQADGEAYAANLGNELQSLKAQLIELQAKSPDKAFTARSFQTIAALAQQRLGATGFVPLRAFEQAQIAFDRFEAEGFAAFRTAKDELFGRFAVIRQRFEQNAADAPALESEWRESIGAALARLRPWADDLAARIEKSFAADFAGTLKDKEQSFRDELTRAVGGAIEPLLDEIELSAGEIPPFDLAPPDWDRIAAIPGILANIRGDWLLSFRDTVLAKLKEEIASAAKLWMDQFDAEKRRFAEATEELLAKIEADAKAGLNDAVKQFDAWAENNAAALTGWIGAQVTAIKDNAALDELAGDFDEVGKLVDAIGSDPLKVLADALARAAGVDEIAAQLDAAARSLGDGLKRAAQHAEHAIVSEVKAQAGDLLDQATEPALELGRALATGIETDTLQCTRDALGYYYGREFTHLDVTRASAILNDLGQGNLNALSAVVPFYKIRERLLPQLENLDLSSIFPDFAGLKLEHLFPELKIVKDKLGEYEWLKIRHGFDKDRLTAWSDVNIDKLFDQPPTLLAIPPVTLTLGNARLRAHCRMEVSQSGVRTQDISGSILADWMLNLSGKPIVTMMRAALVFGNDGKFDFDFASENIVLADELKFITDAMKALLPQDEGLTITPALPAGIKAELALPLPDLGTGAFTLTGVTLFSHLALTVSNGFTITTGFWLSRPERPFGLAILFLGGGGWVGVEISYTPPKIFDTRVSIGVSAGAFVALNLGFARASAGLLFTAGVEFRRVTSGGGGSTAVSLGLIIWGDFSILSIANAYLRITAQVTYTHAGGMIARGRVEVKIRISYFYTLRLSRGFERRFSKGSQSTNASNLLEMSADPLPDLIPLAIAHHFQTLDLP